MNDSARTAFNATPIVFPDGTIATWAGASPRPDEFAFGTETGFLRFSFIDRFIPEEVPSKIVPSSEAINGLAFVERDDYRFLAASTRAELVVHRHANDGRHIGYALHEGGAHGVHATAWGGFLAPLGRAGLVSISPGQSGDLRQSILSGNNGVPYFYKLASLGLKGNREVWIAAGRTDGLIAVFLGKDGEIDWGRALQSRNQPVDFVGVCSIGTPEYPLAAASLGRDRSLRLSFDALADHRPVTLVFPEMQGTAYKVLSCMGHVFIHTKSYLYIFKEMASRFLQGESLAGLNPVHYIRTNYFDFNIAYDRLLLLNHQGINVIPMGDLDLMGVATQSDAGSTNTVQTDFDWEPNESMNLVRSESSLLVESDLHLV